MLAKAAGLPPLYLMSGFFDSGAYGTPFFGQQYDLGKDKRKRLEEDLPISWDCLKPNPLYELLYHSDCDGEIESDKCALIADALEALIPLLPKGEAVGHIGNWRDKTAQFVAGLRAAAAAGEPLEFH